MTEHRLAARARAPHPGMPLSHVARFRGVELEAEAVADLALRRQHPCDERLLACLQAHGMHVDES
jgi:hypothetical protein